MPFLSFSLSPPPHSLPLPLSLSFMVTASRKLTWVQKNRGKQNRLGMGRKKWERRALGTKRSNVSPELSSSCPLHYHSISVDVTMESESPG